MANIVHTIKLVADAKKAATDIRAYRDEVVAAASTVKKYAGTLNGDQILKAANTWTAAIAKLGGATKDAATNEQLLAGVAKLSASEKEKVNRALGEAIEKYKLLGQSAPSAMTALAEATKKVPPKLTLAQKAAGLLQSTFGQFTAASLVSSAVQKLASSVGEFIQRGTQLPAIEQSYQRLTGAMRINADTMLTKMRAGTKSMVADIDLMQSANKALLLGLPITAESMGSLAKTATTLGKAMGQDATKSLDDLITALGRSSPMILDNLGLSVKVGEANEAYARKLGKTADQLTQAQQKMAFYEAAMEAARKKTEELGEPTQTLGEIALSVWTRVGNVVTGAAADINIGLGRALSSGRGFIDFIQDAIKFGPAGAVAMGALAEKIKALEAARKGRMGKDVNLESFESTLAKVRAAATQAAGAVVPLNAQQRELALLFDKTGLAADKIAEKLNEVQGWKVNEQAVKNLLEAHKKAIEQAQRYAETQREIALAHRPLTLAQRAQIDELLKLGVATGKIVDSMKTVGGEMTVSEAQVSRYTDKLKDEAKALAEIGKNLDTIRHNVQLRLPSRDLSGVAPVVKGGTQLDPFGIDWEAIQKNNAMYLDRMAGKAQATYAYMRTHSKEFSEATIRHFKKAADEARHAADGTRSAWDRVYGALGNVSSIFDSIGGKFSETMSMMARTGQAVMSNLAEGNIFGAVTAGVTGAIGVFKKLVGAAHEGRDAVKKWVTDNFGDFDALHAKLQTLGAAGEALWMKLTQGVGRNSPEQAKAVIDEINAAFKTQDGIIADLNAKIDETKRAIANLGGNGVPSLAMLEEASKRLGVSTDHLGQAFQDAKAKANWQSVIDDLDTLRRGGADINQLLGDQGLQKTFQDLVDQSRKFGTDIPANAKPWIQSLIDQHKLLGDNKQEITDISTLHFGGDMQTTLDTLNGTLRDLVDTLNSKLPAAAKVAADGMNAEFGRVRPPKITPYADPDAEPIPMAHGGSFLVTRPTLFLAGEAGPERATFSGAGNTSTPRGQQPSSDSRLLEELRRLLRDQPRAIAVAMQDAMALSAGRA